MIKQKKISTGVSSSSLSWLWTREKYKEEKAVSRLRQDFLMGLTRFSCNLYILSILFVLSKKRYSETTNLVPM
jgi:hypothetical protein